MNFYIPVNYNIIIFQILISIYKIKTTDTNTNKVDFNKKYKIRITILIELYEMEIHSDKSENNRLLCTKKEMQNYAHN
jgi:hypothetical protein